MIVIRFLLIQACIFMPSFIFALLFIPSLNVLSRKLLQCLTRFGYSSQYLDFDEFCDPASLITALFLLSTGVLPLYFWIGNPFCWSCYPLRFLIAAPAGLGFMVMVLTPSMGIAKYRVMTKVPELKSVVAGPSDIIFMIGLVFWVILIVGFLFWKIFSNFVLDLCPCLTWCMEDDDKKKNKEEEKTTGCLCF